MQTDSFSCGPHANVLKSRGSTRQETAVFIKFNFFPLKKYAAFSLLQKKLCKPTPATCRCFKEAWLKNRGNCFVHKIYFLPPQKNTPHFRSFKKCYVSLLDTNLLPPCNDETPTVCNHFIQQDILCNQCNESKKSIGLYSYGTQEVIS